MRRTRRSSAAFASASAPTSRRPRTRRGGADQDLRRLAHRQGRLHQGYGSGPARISTKHTLALTNRGEATTEDLLALAREVVAGVRDAFGVTLVNEPVTVGVSL